MVTIVPSILAKDVDSFKRDLEKVWGFAKRVQLDVVDGRFAEEKTVGPEVLLEVDTIVDFDVHLMVSNPEAWVDRCAKSGAVAVYGQVEKLTNVTKFIADAQFAGMKVGLAYDVETELVDLEKYVNDIDAVLLMAVKAGAQGREFDERVLEKIKLVRLLNKSVVIIIDGGLATEEIKKCIVAEWAEEAAEDEMNKSFIGMEFAVGSDILQADNPKAEFEKLEQLQS